LGLRTESFNDNIRFIGIFKIMPPITFGRTPGKVVIDVPNEGEGTRATVNELRGVSLASVGIALQEGINFIGRERIHIRTIGASTSLEYDGRPVRALVFTAFGFIQIGDTFIFEL
jgi:hypothetical protein